MRELRPRYGIIAIALALLIILIWPEKEYYRKAPLSGELLDEYGCPRYIKPDNPRVTATRGKFSNPPDAGTPLETIGLVKAPKADGNGFFYYRMPIGYSLNWLTWEEESRFDPNTPLFGTWWTFWMPEKRYPEMPVGYSLMTKAYKCEQGRPYPSEDHYLVSFGVEALVNEKLNSGGTPEHMWRRKFKKPDGDIILPSGIITRQSTSGDFVIPEKLSSARQLPNGLNADKGWGIGRVYYRNPENHPYQFMIECADSFSMLCSSQFYFPDRNLNIVMHFTRERVDMWEDILVAAMELLDHWQVDLDLLPVFQN
ncbi:hypothetical protein [Kordiimonas pumila]|uniref:Methanolan biosynthesis EpsI domain-containing protein n=1 Tax=Kordiimonas pumila TaxID=2161677 RepID=A0ABV7D773_9PROT|nr:hypothetical protein [Kordiimonas pumila]